MTLRDEIDRNTGTMEATRGVASASAFFMRMLLLVACAVLTTLALGGPPLARTPDAIEFTELDDALGTGDPIERIRPVAPFLEVFALTDNVRGTVEQFQAESAARAV